MPPGNRFDACAELPSAARQKATELHALFAREEQRYGDEKQEIADEANK